MEKWFEVESIDETTFSISEYNHWEKFHSYLLIGKESALLIDTGLGIGKIKKVVNSITDLPILVVATHIHWDHIGGHGEFSKHFVHELEENWIINGIPLPLEIIKRNVTKEVKRFPEEFDIGDYKVFTSEVCNVIHDGYKFDLGEREIEVIHTPGHSPGHICLYEKDKKYLFSGDLIYKGKLYANYPSTDPQLFSESVRKVSNLDVDRILPSHNDLDVKVELINEIKLAFDYIEKKVGLKHCGKNFKFENIEIRI